MSNVKIQNLTRTFETGTETVTAVDSIDLTIHDGEFVTLVGPSGCGKTTTLRCVSGLEKPDSGTIQFGDRDVTHLPVQERNIALLFQDIALYPHMSVRKNMAYGLKIAGVSKEERNERVQEAAEMLQVSEQLDKSPVDLSGGQQQRVALGRSLTRDPSVFLFDEPMSDLDAKLKRDLRPVVREVTDHIGCPVLYVTHDQEEAMTMSDRIAVMNDGELEQVSKPKNVYQDPQSEFVSSFIGQQSTQSFDGHLGKTQDGIQLTINRYQINLPESAKSLEGYVGEEVRVGIRPQKINIEDDSSLGIPATHKFDELLGDIALSYFNTGFGERKVVTDPDFEGNNKEYGLVFDPQAVKLFDPTSGVRIY